jgi:integrase
LRVSELAGLTREHIDWQNHRLMIYGKGGIYGTKSKRRIIPLTDRIRPLIDGHFAIHDTIGMTPRTIQRILKRPRSWDRPLYARRGGLRGAGGSSTDAKIAANIERGF